MSDFYLAKFDLHDYISFRDVTSLERLHLLLNGDHRSIKIDFQLFHLQFYAWFEIDFYGSNYVDVICCPIQRENC